MNFRHDLEKTLSTSPTAAVLTTTKSFEIRISRYNEPCDFQNNTLRKCAEGGLFCNENNLCRCLVNFFWNNFECG